MHSLWQNRVKDAVQNKLTASTLAAFNTNVDVVVHLNDSSLKKLQADPRLDLSKVESLRSTEITTIVNGNEFLAVLMEALEAGKSHYIVLSNMQLLNWLEEVFAERKESMGGQAGIIANQMAALGARSIVYTSLLSPKQASMFFPEVDVPVIEGNLAIVNVKDGVRSTDQIKENWIFEYAKGERFEINGHVIVTPRANRVILATRPQGIKMGFGPEMDGFLPSLGQEIDVAFLAGFHYAPTKKDELDQYLASSMDSVHQLKEQNPRLRFHFEYVPMSEAEAEKSMLKAVATEIQSFGINENEIKRVLNILGYERECAAIEGNERAFCLYEGSLRIMEHLGFERIQLHNLGYYVVVLKKPYPLDPKQVREACLYASSVNAIKAKYGGYVLHEKLTEAGEIALSQIGLDQLQAFALEMKSQGIQVPADFTSEGILEREDHYVLVIPAHVVPNPVSTVGMGDTISSSAFAYEWSPR